MNKRIFTGNYEDIEFNITEEEKHQFAIKTVYGKFDGIHTRQLLKYLLANSKYPPCTLSQKIRYEQEFLGYIDYKDNKLDKRIVVVTKVDTTYSPKLEVFCLKNGQVAEIKIHKRKNQKDKGIKVSWNELPLEEGDIIYMRKCEKERKRRKNKNNEWEGIQGQFEWWLNDYDKIENL